ncbi:hypothetical protein GLW08_12610 [Pontibacillus yanchengensis]|uniref:Uncharacterized protein n=1 Tax=Pontibacillus yanchengensis TaxID=462910 RepID=A0ACC7VJ64_9BACI|nr:hypothetical protein [Pontibacillus yanchengensis]MYL54179.1 hypothetical protein [Pontibacillus yanchengensis]
MEKGFEGKVDTLINNLKNFYKIEDNVFLEDFRFALLEKEDIQEAVADKNLECMYKMIVENTPMVGNVECYKVFLLSYSCSFSEGDYIGYVANSN